MHGQEKVVDVLVEVVVTVQREKTADVDVIQVLAADVVVVLGVIVLLGKVVDVDVSLLLLLQNNFVFNIVREIYVSLTIIFIKI